MDAATDLLFRTLGDPTRRALFERLAGEALTVRALTSHAGVSQPAVSKHLGVLAPRRLVEGRAPTRDPLSRARRGAETAARLDGPYAQFWEARFDALEDLLKRWTNDEEHRRQREMPAPA